MNYKETRKVLTDFLNYFDVPIKDDDVIIPTEIVRQILEFVINQNEELNLIKKKYTTEVIDKIQIMVNSLDAERKVVEEFVEFLKHSTTYESFDDLGKIFLEKNYGIKNCEDLKKR